MDTSRRRFLEGTLAGVGGAAIASTLPPAPLSAQATGAPARPGSATRDATMRLTFRPYTLELRHVFTIATSSRTTTPVMLTEIACDGVTGYGEASMPPYLGESHESAAAFLAKVDLSPFRDPFQLEDILAYVDGVAPGNPAAKAAVDIALHDLVGKLIGQPWWRVWGYDRAKTPATSFTIGIDTPDVVRQKTLEAAGYKVLKVKLGRDTDRQIIETIRSVTKVPITADANQGWKDRVEALDEIQWLKEQGVVFVEQPMAKDRPEDNAWITARSPIPILGDEAVQRLADVRKASGIYSGINIKLMKSTGLREAREMLTLARALDMKVLLGCMTETSCGISAATQIAPAVDWADLDGALLIRNDPFEGAKLADGVVRATDAPGIGLTKTGAGNRD
jgi:L-alanine-DL-glutamate epimerase-like enolase superfamily enzyme